jgi:hypothetical protein
MSLYQPNYLTPNGSTIDPSAVNTFSCKIQGTICVAYDMTIYKNSDSSVVYNTTKITNPTPLYNNQTLSITVNAAVLTVGTEYKWRIKLYWDETNYIESGEIFFKAYNSPSLSLTVSSPINSNNYTFAPTFTQTQGIGVKFFTAYLFDSTGVQLSTSDKVYSANVQYNFDGFISGNTYKVQFIAIDQNDMQANTGVQSFTVSYSEPSINIKPTVEFLTSSNAIKLKWSNALQITGQSTGTFTYSSDVFFTGSKEVNINTNSTLFYTSTIPEQFTVLHKTKLPVGFVGKILELYTSVGSEVYTVGYDGVHFYYIIDGYTRLIPHTLPTNAILMAIRPTDIYIKFY